jgi:hypothetical protein
MSFALPFDPLLLLLDDPALLAALLAPPEPELAPAQAAPAAPPPPPAAPAPEPLPDDAFPDIAAMEAMLAQSLVDEAEAAPDLALRQELAGWLGLDDAQAGDEAAFLAVLADLPPPVAEELPEGPSGAGYDPTWQETVREDWALG